MVLLYNNWCFRLTKFYIKGYIGKGIASWLFVFLPGNELIWLIIS